MSFQDRDYQTTSEAECERLMALKEGPVLLVLPTGAGKTKVASSVIHTRAAVGRDKPMFLAPRREIVYQTALALRRMQMDPGLIMAGHDYTPKREVQVASIDTLRSWIRRGRVRLNNEHTLIVDEAHRAISDTHQWIISAYADAGADVLGLTATPIRSDGRGMAPTFAHMHVGLTMTRAVLDGWLVKPDYRIAYVPDMAGVKTIAGDFSARDLDRIMREGKLIGDVVTNWLKYAADRPTLVFASGIKHSMAIVEEFTKVGVRAMHIDGDTDKDIRDKAIKAIDAGQLDVLSSCGVFVEGTDIPRIGCIIDAQPTKSLGRHIQKLGRGLRTLYESGMPLDTVEQRLLAIAASEKPNCLILDHAGNFYRNGRVDRNFPWALCEGKEIVERVRKKVERAPVAFTCDECGKVFGGQLYCPQCGTKIEIKGKMHDYVEADLVSMTAGEFEKIQTTVTETDERRFYLECLFYCRQPRPVAKKHAYLPPVQRAADGYAAVLFQQKFKKWPPSGWIREKPITTGRDVKNYIRSRNIARARARASSSPA